MAKFSGSIGFVMPAVETPPGSGIWEPEGVSEKRYRGDLLDNVRQVVASDNLSDNIRLDNTISIVISQFFRDNYMNISYVRFRGQVWKVESVKFEGRRAIISIGGIWNGPVSEEIDS